MSASLRTYGFVALPTLAVLAAVGWAAASFLRLGVPEVPEAEHTDQLASAKEADISQALTLILEARKRFSSIKDYRCTYLRDEYIDKEMRRNQILLSVRHEPFSVHMEWIAPKSKSGRRAAFIEGANNGRMRVKESFLTLNLNPQKSVDMKESRHTIVETGLRNMIERFCKRWEVEKQLGLTKVWIQDGEVRVMLQDGERVRPCRCVTTLHDPKDRQHFTFYRTLLFFDKETGLPIRMQGHDWPKSPDDKEGLLLEDYTYLDWKTNLGLKDEDFKW